MRKDERIRYGFMMYLLERLGPFMYMDAKYRDYFKCPSYSMESLRDQIVYCKILPMSTQMLLLGDKFKKQAELKGRNYLGVVKYLDQKENVNDRNRRPVGFPFETFFY